MPHSSLALAPLEGEGCEWPKEALEMFHDLVVNEDEVHMDVMLDTPDIKYVDLVCRLNDPRGPSE